MEKELLAEIIHTIRTPSVAIQASSFAIKNYLPVLIQAYKEAKKHNLAVSDIPEQNLAILEKVLTNIENEAKDINSYLDKLSLQSDI